MKTLPQYELRNYTKSQKKRKKKKNTFRGDTTPLLQRQKVNRVECIGSKGEKKKLVKWKMQKIHPFNEELLETKALGLTLSAKFGRMAAADYSSNSCGINGKTLCNIGKRYIKTDIKFILFRDDSKPNQRLTGGSGQFLLF